MSAYCCSDLHGNKIIYDKIIDYVGDNKLFILGDLCDRGLNGYAMIKDALSRSNITYIKGNHEELFVNTAWDIIQCSYWTTAVDCHIVNGGTPTIIKWIEDGKPTDILNQLKNLPEYIEYKNDKYNILLCHSGSKKDWLWDRSHFYKNEELPEGLIIIHGHTPVNYMTTMANLPYANGKVYWHNKHQKLNIDLETASSNKAALINLDTLEPIYFTEKGIDK